VVAAGGSILAGGLVTSGTESKVSGQLETGSDVEAVVESDEPLLIVEDGGQAGIVCSVGGSGGQTSVSSGIAPCRGATSSSGAAADCSFVLSGAVCGPAAGGHVRLEVVAGSSVSATGSPGGAGTVCAHFGAGFCIGTACFGSVARSGSAGVSVLAHSGSESFCIGSAGRGSASAAVLSAPWVPLSLTGGATGTVLAQTGVVSCVGTAATGSSVGAVSCGLSDCDSKSIVSLAGGYRV
jgi:hypothetical protein